MNHPDFINKLDFIVHTITSKRYTNLRGHLSQEYQQKTAKKAYEATLTIAEKYPREAKPFLSYNLYQALTNFKNPEALLSIIPDMFSAEDKKVINHLKKYIFWQKVPGKDRQLRRNRARLAKQALKQIK